MARWQSLGLAAACADLVGTMRGALALATEYARERKQYGATIGSFQAVQHLLADAHVATEGSRSIALHAAWAVDALPADDALAACSAAKAYCARAARSVCETSIQVHGGIGNTWECLAHVFLRRALFSTDVLGGSRAEPRARAGCPRHRRRRWTSLIRPKKPRSAAACATWLADNNPGLPPSSTADEYWAGQAAWHQTLYDAGFFGLSWPKSVGGQELPSVYDVILDEELIAAAAPPRPSVGYLVQGMLEHGSEEVQQRFLPGLVSGRERWCQGFSEPDAGSDLASLRTKAVLDGSEYVITGHKVWTSYSDAADWCLVLARTDPDVPKHRGISAFAVPMRQSAITQRPLKMINGITREFGEVIFDGARVDAANMIGRTR